MRKEPEMKEAKRRKERKKTGRNKEVTDKKGGQGTTDGRMREGVKEEEEIRKET